MSPSILWFFFFEETLMLHNIFTPVLVLSLITCRSKLPPTTVMQWKATLPPGLGIALWPVRLHRGHTDTPSTDRCSCINDRSSWSSNVEIKAKFLNFVSSAFIHILILWTSGITASSTATDNTFESSANHHLSQSEWPEWAQARYRQARVSPVDQQCVVCELGQWRRAGQGHDDQTALVVYVKGKVQKKMC